jgi:mono/diheme cytochrome c family protein
VVSLPNVRLALHLALMVLLAGAGAAASLATVSCTDEVHNEEVAALGPEVSGVPPVPLHRPGQPCLTCHGGSGPAKLQLSEGGTVYLSQGGGAPAPGATVQIEDILGNLWTVQANAAGNFFATLSDYAPHYPTQMQVTSADGTVTNQMLTHAGRDGSCADCHTPTEGPTSPGPVYVNAAGTDGG